MSFIDLYDAWVAEDLRSNLMVESWQKGSEKENIPSNCTSAYKVRHSSSYVYLLREEVGDMQWSS